jgi:hypothetical protein
MVATTLGAGRRGRGFGQSIGFDIGRRRALRERFFDSPRRSDLDKSKQFRGEDKCADALFSRAPPQLQPDWH